MKNGVIDLMTGKLRKREPEDMIYTVLDIVYDEHADTTVMQNVVLSAMADDAEMAEYLQRLLGGLCHHW